MTRIIRHKEINQDSVATCFDHVLGVDGQAITQANVASISVTVTDTKTSTTTHTDTLDVTAVIFDTLQSSDPRWEADRDGYNFRHTVPSSAFPEGDRDYRIEYEFVDINGNTWWTTFGVYVHKVYAA